MKKAAVKTQTDHVEAPPRSPALLVSYVYLEQFRKHQADYHYRDWVLDSGAFSAYHSAAKIDLQAYIETCQQLLYDDPTLTEIFALDVIDDWRVSLRNYEKMTAAGVPVIPCYHSGEPESVLLGLARDYPKIAISGRLPYKQKIVWASQCFARVWPKKIHGFGFGSESALFALPWHSVDATSWETGPSRFGRWRAFGQMSVRGSAHTLRAEVEWYLDLEERARFRWAKEMELIGERDLAPIVRLAAQQSSAAQIHRSGLHER